MRCDLNGCNTCKTAGIFASVLLAIAVGLLSYFGYFTFPEFALYTALSTGAAVTMGSMAGMGIRRSGGAFSCCLCKNAMQILTGAVGSFLMALAAIVIGTGAGAAITAVIMALTAFFFFLLLSGIICVAVCLINTCD